MIWTAVISVTASFVRRSCSCSLHAWSDGQVPRRIAQGRSGIALKSECPLLALSVTKPIDFGILRSEIDTRVERAA